VRISISEPRAFSRRRLAPFTVTKTKRAVISIDLPVLPTPSRHYAYLILVTAAHFPQLTQL
jgi:hypothetical protein